MKYVSAQNPLGIRNTAYTHACIYTQRHKWRMSKTRHAEEYSSIAVKYLHFEGVEKEGKLNSILPNAIDMLQQRE